MNTKLTKKEKKAIIMLKELAKNWPESLWIFCGDGVMRIMRKRKDGKKALTLKRNIGGGDVDPSYMIEEIIIDNWCSRFEGKWNRVN